MSEEMSFEEYLEEEANFKQPHKGEVVEGTVIDVKDNEIILNSKAKSDGVLTKSEYSNNPDVDLKSEVKVGDELTVKVVSVNDSEGQVMVTYKRLQQDKVNKRFEEAFENHEILTGTVTQALKGGLSVSYGEGRVFIQARRDEYTSLSMADSASAMERDVYSSRRAWFPTFTREILRSTRIRRSSLY